MSNVTKKELHFPVCPDGGSKGLCKSQGCLSNKRCVLQHVRYRKEIITGNK